MYAPRPIDKPVGEPLLLSFPKNRSTDIWRLIDGEVHLVFQPPNTNQFPSDGVRYLEGENRFVVNVGGHVRSSCLLRPFLTCLGL
jgi:hypothetical protein